MKAISTTHDYFAATLARRNQYDLRAALTAGNIAPGASYPSWVLQQAVKSALGFTPLLGCSAGSPDQKLSEISLCLDTGLAAFECADSVKVLPSLHYCTYYD